MNYLMHPADLVSGAKTYIDGFNHVVETEDIELKDLLDIAIHVVSEWSSDWPEDQGFGSSDRTYMMKDFIDTILWSQTRDKYKTVFNPGLKVVNNK
jgi:hypothetical protein